MPAKKGASNSSATPSSGTIALSANEKRVIDAFRTGTIADFGDVRPERGTAANTLRADVLRGILIGRHVSPHDRDPRGLHIKGAFINGPLDLRGARIDCLVTLENCWIDGALIIEFAELDEFDLRGSRCAGISGQAVKLNHSLMLTAGFRCEGEALLVAADIGGNLNLSGAKLVNRNRHALSCDRAQIKGSLFFRGTEVRGTIRFPTAHIGGNVQFMACLLSNPMGDAVSFNSAVVDGTFNMTQCLAFGEVDLSSLRCSLDVGFLETVIDNSARLLKEKPKSGDAGGSNIRALRLASAVIKGDVRIDGAFWCGVFMNGTEIGKDLLLKESFYIAPFFIKKAPADPEIFFENIQRVIGNTYFSSESHNNSINIQDEGFGSQRCLSVDGATIGNSLYIREKSTWLGSVSLEGVNCSAILNSVDGAGKDWPQYLSVGGMSYEAFQGASPTDAKSVIDWISRAPGAQGVEFDPTPWEHATKALRNMGRRSEAADVQIDMERRLDRTIKWCGEPLIWRAKNLAWPKWPIVPSKWRGEPIKWQGEQIKLRERHLAWPKWAIVPSKWRGEPIKGIGHPFKKVFRWMYCVFSGYGQKPARTFCSMLLLWLGSSAFFYHSATHAVFAPTAPLVFQRAELAHCSPTYFDEVKQIGRKKDGGIEPTADEARKFAEATAILNRGKKIGNWYKCADLPGEYTTFSPIMYAADLILPLVDLQQEKDWAPYIASPSAYPKNWLFDISDIFNLTSWTRNHLTRLVVWINIIMGWVFSLMLIASLTEMMRRKE